MNDIIKRIIIQSGAFMLTIENKNCVKSSRNEIALIVVKATDHTFY